ncbi:MAG: PilX N-terminal domain-containing pilus assembly protein, partial [Acidimicrobiia bacterium]
MKERRVQHRKEQKGFILIVALFVMAILATLALGFLSTSMTETTIASNYANQTRAFYAAEAGLESGLVGLRSLLTTTGSPTDADLTGLLPPALNDPYYTFTTFQVGRVRANPPYDYPTVMATGPYAGLNAIATDYRITAVVTGPRRNRAQLNQLMKNLQIPLFQFGAFYGEGVDFEVYAGPTFTFTGRLHANSDIYLADSGSNGMFFDSYVTSAGDFYRRRKDQACCDRRGNPDVKDGGGAYQALDFDREVKNISADGSTWDAGDVDHR